MADDVLLSFKSLCAGFTGEKSLCAVDVFLVDLQVTAVGEGLQTGLTAVDDVSLDAMIRAVQEKKCKLQTE